MSSSDRASDDRGGCAANAAEPEPDRVTAVPGSRSRSLKKRGPADVTSICGRERRDAERRGIAHKRTNFGDRQKAQIFVRDRATCSFDGESLWLPDQGVKATYLSDWVDHVVPSFHGGPATLDNGVCAPHRRNFERGADALGAVYRFREGRVAAERAQGTGAPSEAQLAGLARRGALVEADWYLNRAVEKAFNAF